MTLIPFKPIKATELVPGVAFISKNDSSYRWRITQPTVPQIIRGTIAKDATGHPTGLVYYKPLDQDYDRDLVMFVSDMKRFNDIANFYKIEP